MKKICLIMMIMVMLKTLAAQNNGTTVAMMNKVKLEFTVSTEGEPCYTVQYNNSPVINKSKMGFTFTGKDVFDRNFTLVASENKSVDNTWKPVLGEYNTIRN